ncbi:MULTISPECIES: AraC family transcriptional regulator [Enterobacterales]|uniref:AraC family transcriptional regulator n=1 Tax=Candidatus Sodalis endolongispinus TaxID=2812662 RepID=A0ABS5YCE2_9GAMM|nr:MULTISPECIES: AraC family transcriptional regulator [Enterobacterales]MBG6247503.1 AraC family transcriptional regulator [Candidatus Symbiopectobacterium sp. PLON1]MBT9432618.1 AraC family transcriptional regulator [Candidatus Sodalis endolongispinus]
MSGVPANVHYEKNRAQFRLLPGLEGVELYRAHLLHHAFEPHSHDAFGLGIIDAGAERFRYRVALHLAPRHSLVMMNPDELHTGEAVTEEGWRYRMIYIAPPALCALSGEIGWCFGNVVRQDPVRAAALSRLLEALWQSQEALCIAGLVLEITDLLRPHAYLARLPRAEAPHRLDIVRNYIVAYYARAITLEEMAGLVFLSPYHFLRQFKARFHATPHQVLMSCLLSQAKRMLARGMPAADVAAAAGLTDQAHLTRAFALRYGTTPVRYQKQVIPAAR